MHSHPRSVIDGFLSALHVKLGHPSRHQMKLVPQRHFLDLDNTLDRCCQCCLLCSSLKKVPSSLVEQSSSNSPQALGSSLAATLQNATVSWSLSSMRLPHPSPLRLVVKYATQRNMRNIRRCQSVKYAICGKRFILSAVNLQNVKHRMLTVSVNTHKMDVGCGNCFQH